MHNNKSRGSLPRIVLFLFVLISTSTTSFAHPMGNFSVNHYSKVKIGQRSVEIRYVIDMAEIPTFQEIREFGITPNADDPSASRYLDREEQLLKAGLSLESYVEAVRLDTLSRQVAFAEGAGGLPTMKIEFVFRAKLEVNAGAHKLSYLDNNFPGRSGWREIVVLGDGVAILDSSAPATDRSQELTNYSSDALNSPPQQLSALVEFTTSLSEQGRSAAAAVTGTASKRTILKEAHTAHRRPSSGGIISSDLIAAPSSSSDVVASTVPSSSLAAHAQNTPRSRFTELISTQGKLTFWVLFSAALIAAGLGALHALEPGH